MVPDRGRKRTPNYVFGRGCASDLITRTAEAQA